MPTSFDLLLIVASSCLHTVNFPGVLNLYLLVALEYDCALSRILCLIKQSTLALFSCHTYFLSSVLLLYASFLND